MRRTPSVKGCALIWKRNSVFSTVAVICLAVTMMQRTAAGQGLTGQVSGRVQDPGGLLVSGADVALTSVATGLSRTARSNGNGEFLFLDVLPGDYDLHVSATGFKAVEKKRLVLSSGQLLVIGSIALELGPVNDTVTVAADPAPLETQSSDSSGLIDRAQLQQLSLKGRDYLGLLKLLPGVL